MQPLKVFGIPITPVGYYMDCVLTNAQIELIMTDVTVTDYDYNNKKGKKKPGEFDNAPADSEKVREAGQKWLEKYGDGADAGKGLSIQDILGGSGLSTNTEVGLKIKK